MENRPVVNQPYWRGKRSNSIALASLTEATPLFGSINSPARPTDDVTAGVAATFYDDVASALLHDDEETGMPVKYPNQLYHAMRSRGASTSPRHRNSIRKQLSAAQQSIVPSDIFLTNCYSHPVLSLIQPLAFESTDTKINQDIRHATIQTRTDDYSLAFASTMRAPLESVLHEECRLVFDSINLQRRALHYEQVAATIAETSRKAGSRLALQALMKDGMSQASDCFGIRRGRCKVDVDSGGLHFEEDASTTSAGDYFSDPTSAVLSLRQQAQEDRMISEQLFSNEMRERRLDSMLERVSSHVFPVAVAPHIAKALNATEHVVNTDQACDDLKNLEECRMKTIVERNKQLLHELSTTQHSLRLVLGKYEDLRKGRESSTSSIALHEVTPTHLKEELRIARQELESEFENKFKTVQSDCTHLRHAAHLGWAERLRHSQHMRDIEKAEREKREADIRSSFGRKLRRQKEKSESTLKTQAADMDRQLKNSAKEVDKIKNVATAKLNCSEARLAQEREVLLMQFHDLLSNVDVVISSAVSARDREWRARAEQIERVYSQEVQSLHNELKDAKRKAQSSSEPSITVIVEANDNDAAQPSKSENTNSIKKRDKGSLSRTNSSRGERLSSVFPAEFQREATPVGFDMRTKACVHVAVQAVPEATQMPKVDAVAQTLDAYTTYSAENKETGTRSTQTSTVISTDFKQSDLKVPEPSLLSQQPQKENSFTSTSKLEVVDEKVLGFTDSFTQTATTCVVPDQLLSAFKKSFQEIESVFEVQKQYFEAKMDCWLYLLSSFFGHEPSMPRATTASCETQGDPMTQRQISKGLRHKSPQRKSSPLSSDLHLSSVMSRSESRQLQRLREYEEEQKLRWERVIQRDGSADTYRDRPLYTPKKPSSARATYSK